MTLTIAFDKTRLDVDGGWEQGGMHGHVEGWGISQEDTGLIAPETFPTL